MLEWLDDPDTHVSPYYYTVHETCPYDVSEENTSAFPYHYGTSETMANGKAPDDTSDPVPSIREECAKYTSHHVDPHGSDVECTKGSAPRCNADEV